MKTTATSSRWTAEEDELLRKLVDTYGDTVRERASGARADAAFVLRTGGASLGIFQGGT
jgi:hypothetical protein